MYTMYCFCTIGLLSKKNKAMWKVGQIFSANGNNHFRITRAKIKKFGRNVICEECIKFNHFRPCNKYKFHCLDIIPIDCFPKQIKMWKAGQTVTIKSFSGNIICRVVKAKDFMGKAWGDNQRAAYCLQDKLPKNHFLVTNYAVYGIRIPLY